MPKKKAPSHGGDPFEGKGGTDNNIKDERRQRQRENTAGDRKTRAGGVAVKSDDKSSVIGVAGNHNHRSSGHSSGLSSGRANVEEWFPSSATHGYGASDEVEDDSGEEEWVVPTMAVAAAASRPQRPNTKNVNYSYAAYHKESQRHLKEPSSNRYSALADDDDEEDASVVDNRKMPADGNVSEDDTDTDSNTSEDDSDEFEMKTGGGSDDSSLDIDTESEEEERGGDSSSCSSDMMTMRRRRRKKKKTGSKRNGNGKQRSKKSKNAKGKAKKDRRSNSYSERYQNDWENGNPNGAVAHVQRRKAAKGNYPHRLQKVLNGDTVKSGDYSVRYLQDSRPHAQGFSVSGTRDQLEALGRDTANTDYTHTGSRTSEFTLFKHELVRKWVKGEKQRPVFKIYKDGDDIPAGCLPSNPIPNGRFPERRKNEVFTYYFYYPGFDATFDCLKIAPFITEDDSSISDSSI